MNCELLDKILEDDMISLKGGKSDVNQSIITKPCDKDRDICMMNTRD